MWRGAECFVLSIYSRSQCRQQIWQRTATFSDILLKQEYKDNNIIGKRQKRLQPLHFRTKTIIRVGKRRSEDIQNKQEPHLGWGRAYTSRHVPRPTSKTPFSKRGSFSLYHCGLKISVHLSTFNRFSRSLNRFSSIETRGKSS